MTLNLGSLLLNSFGIVASIALIGFFALWAYVRRMGAHEISPDTITKFRQFVSG